MTAIHSDTTNFQSSPYRVTGEQLVVRRNTSELNHSELEYEVVDELLSLSLSQSAVIDVTLDIDIEECRDTSDGHCSAVLGLDSSQIAEVCPLNSLACVCSRLGDIAAVGSSHNLHLLECADLVSQLRFEGEDVKSIKELDTKGNVLYCGTFSKTLAPGLRVGYLLGASDVVSKAVVGLQTSTVHTNIWAQMLTYRFLTNVDFDEHLKKLQAIYRHKCHLMLGGLEKELPDFISFTHPQGGLFIWATLPDKYDINAFCKGAVERKVAVVPGNAFCSDESAVSHSFRLNFSTPTDEQIEKGVKILGAAAKELLK